MKTEETKIYNSLIKLIYDLECNLYDIKEDIVRFIITSFFNNKDLLIDPIICERLAILINSSNISTEILEEITISTEQEIEMDTSLNLGSNYCGALSLDNLFIAYEAYLSLLESYCIYKAKHWHYKYLEENNKEALAVSNEIKDTDKRLVKEFDLKI